MEKEEIRHHLNQIVSNIAAVQSSIQGQSYEDFNANEQVKESTYSYLQEIGQAAHELNEQTNEVMEDSMVLGQLSNLRNARYNQEAELADQNIWALITNDLTQVGEEIEQSELYSVH